MNDDRLRICPLCLVRGLAVRLDRKGRPMMQCRACAGCIFTRGMALHNVLGVTRLLDAEENLRWVRQEAFAAAERPLAELLGAAPQALPVARSSAVRGAAEASCGEEGAA